MKAKMISLAVLLTMVAAGSALGDTTIETTFKTSGIHGMGASEGTSIQRYQGAKSSESATTRFTGAVLSRIMGQGDTVTITRVDKGVYWTLDSSEKTYKEIPITPFKPGEGKEQPQQKSQVRVTRSEFTVKKTGASETINGFPCAEYLVTWLLETEDVQSREKSRSTMVNNLWTTPETATIRRSQADATEFGRALAKKLGVDMSPKEAKDLGIEAMASTFGMTEADVKQGMAKLKSEMAKVQGYPIRTVVTWNAEGSARGGASGPGGTGTTTAGGGGCLLGGLPGLTSETQGGPFFSSTTEVKSINVDSIPASTFEIPKGFVKTGS